MSKAVMRAAQAARLGYDIIQGATMGGPYGAAAGAVKSLLPSLVRPICLCLLGLLLAVFTAFYSLPSSLFGFDGVEQSQVREMNRRAADLQALYGQFDALTENAAQALGQRLMDTKYETVYDSFEMHRELPSLGEAWTAAIASVASRQEQDAITPEKLAGLAERRLSYRLEEEHYTEELPGTSETEEPISVTRCRLHIHLEAAEPEELMSRLGFSQEEREWARLLHDTLTQSQHSGTEPGGVGNLEDLGDLTFTEGEIPVVYYHQRDSRWAFHPYGEYTLGETGCGPTSLAMVISTFTGRAVTPPELADWSVRKGYCMPEGGSYHSLIPEGARAFGLTAEGLGRDGQGILDALGDGKLVVAIMGPGTFTASGHFLVLRGVTPEGKLLVADSYSLNYSQREWELSLLLQESRSYAAAGGPFWAIGR